MSSQANVYSGAFSSQVWYTDRAVISTGTNPVTYQVSLAPDFGNTIYSNAVSAPANGETYIYVGVGNKLTIVGGNATVQEAGTATSGTAGVQGGPTY